MPSEPPSTLSATTLAPTAADTAAPKIVMVYQPMPAVVGQPTPLTISASVPDGTLDHSVIDFGDGSTVSLTGTFTSTVDHTYKARGHHRRVNGNDQERDDARMTANLNVIPADR